MLKVVNIHVKMYRFLLDSDVMTTETNNGNIAVRARVLTCNILRPLYSYAMTPARESSGSLLVASDCRSRKVLVLTSS